MAETVIRLDRPALDDRRADALIGRHLDARHYDPARVVGGPGGGDAAVYRPDGRPLLVLRRRAIPAAVLAAAVPAARLAARPSHNRGGLSSGTVGHYDREPREPYCRPTAFTQDQPAAWAALVPLFAAADAAYRRALPGLHAEQAAFVGRTSPEYVVPGTAFTTGQVNRSGPGSDARFPCHRDAHNLAFGIGVMACARSAGYAGHLLIFPRWRAAADVRAGDVLLCDVDEPHGNGPAAPTEAEWERITVVMYYRSGAFGCLPPAAELARAQARRSGDPLYDE